MKRFFQFLIFAAIVGAIAYFVKKQLSQGEPTSSGIGDGTLPANATSSLKILVCPADKGPLELVDDGKFLLNPRNGYKYPIRDGIPVMLIEEGKKHRDPSYASNGSGEEQETEAAS
jgi:uncharacterized protein YbaR (Trm112 family)